MEAGREVMGGRGRGKNSGAAHFQNGIFFVLRKAIHFKARLYGVKEESLAVVFVPLPL